MLNVVNSHFPDGTPDNTNFYLMKKEGNISNVKNVNFNLEEIYSELGSTFE